MKFIIGLLVVVFSFAFTTNAFTSVETHPKIEKTIYSDVTTVTIDTVFLTDLLSDEVAILYEVNKTSDLPSSIDVFDFKFLNTEDDKVINAYSKTSLKDEDIPIPIGFELVENKIKEVQIYRHGNKARDKISSILRSKEGQI